MFSFLRDGWTSKCARLRFSDILKKFHILKGEKLPTNPRLHETSPGISNMYTKALEFSISSTRIYIVTALISFVYLQNQPF